MAIGKNMQLPVGTVVRVGDKYGYVWNVGLQKVRGKKELELLHKIQFTHRKHYIIRKRYDERATYTLEKLSQKKVMSVRNKLIHVIDQIPQ